jgi:hypothetical protein
MDKVQKHNSFNTNTPSYTILQKRYLYLGSLGGWCGNYCKVTLRPLYSQGKSPWYPLDGRLGGPQSRSGRGGEEKNSQSPPGIEP